MNKLILIGNLTDNVEVKSYGKGKNAGSVATFTIAVDRDYKDEDGDYLTDFFRLTCFGKRAEFLEEYTEKGCKICVTCQLRNNNYEDEDGNMIYRDQILVDNVEILKHPEKVDKKKKNK